MKHQALFEGLDNYETIMDAVTGDTYCQIFKEGDYRFYDYHADICEKHFPGQDWSWEEALPYWSEQMVLDAIDAFYEVMEGNDLSPIDQLKVKFLACLQDISNKADSDMEAYELACDEMCLPDSNSIIMSWGAEG